MAELLAGVLLSAMLLLLSGCASLPNTSAILDRHAGQQARFETARGPLSARRTSAILERMQRSHQRQPAHAWQQGDPAGGWR